MKLPERIGGREVTWFHADRKDFPSNKFHRYGYFNDLPWQAICYCKRWEFQGNPGEYKQSHNSYREHVFSFREVLIKIINES